eukprot:jgi/Mesvir1/26291/Mv08641-RA.1
MDVPRMFCWVVQARPGSDSSCRQQPTSPLPAGINFNAPVSEDDLAGMVDLHSNLGGKGKVAGDKKDRDDKNDSDDKMVDSGDDDPASRGAHLGSSDLTGDNSIDNVMESTPADERGKGFSRSELEDAKMTLKFPSPDPPVLKTMPVQGRNESTISVGGGVPGFRAECGIMARAVVNLHPWRQNVGIILGGWKNKTMSALLARETKNSSYKSLLCSFTPSMTRPAPTGIHFHNQVALIVANNPPKWCDVPGVTFPATSNCSRGMVPTASGTGDISGCRLAAASLDDIGMAAGTIAATSLLLTVFM